MSIELLALKLRISTEKGPVGTTIPFQPGLWILRADNSSGKSICIQSIVYVLGLEGMLSASHDVPLPHAMTERVDVDGEERAILESEVLLEIKNHAGRILTVARTVKGPYDKHLIRTWDGPAITGSGEFVQRDYFVRQPGAATRELGFHHELASFMGWSLPTVARYDGTLAPLYLECVFPLMLIEQKRGWSAIQARMPLHYRIREVGKRAIEFLLKMDAYAIAAQRERLHETRLLLRNRWAGLLTEAQRIATAAGTVVQGVPHEPTVEWPPAVRPDLIVSVGDEWQPVRVYLKGLRSRLADLEKREIPTVQRQAKELEDTLRETQERLSQREIVHRALFDDVEQEDSEKGVLERKLRALDEDLRKNQDVAKLHKLGSILDMSVSDNHCPTCHQTVSDSLLPQGSSVQPMTIEDNIGFIKEQIDTYRSVHASILSSLNAKRGQLAALRRDVDETRKRIRTIKSTLTSDDRLPSEAAMQERLKLKEQIGRETALVAVFEKHLLRFGEVSTEWRVNETALAALPPDDLSEADRAKLARLEELLREEAAEFGLSSVSPASLGISRDLYRPVHGGFDLDFDLSASDMIRTIWAYLLGLLELSRTAETNHGKLLILDEPRQQETARPSFGAFLRRASAAAESGEQVIFATSEEPSTLQDLLQGVPHVMHRVSGKILKAVPEG
jgi:hypothetical protein